MDRHHWMHLLLHWMKKHFVQTALNYTRTQLFRKLVYTVVRRYCVEEWVEVAGNCLTGLSWARQKELILIVNLISSVRQQIVSRRIQIKFFPTLHQYKSTHQVTAQTKSAITFSRRKGKGFH